MYVQQHKSVIRSDPPYFIAQQRILIMHPAFTNIAIINKPAVPGNLLALSSMNQSPDLNFTSLRGKENKKTTTHL